MTDRLSPQARALLQASRKALRASDADRQRIAAVLRDRLGSGALPPEASSAPASGLTTTSIVAGAAFGVCVIAAVAFLVREPRASAPLPTTPAASAAASAGAGVPPAPELEKPEAEQTVPASSARSEARIAAPARRRDSLAREVALLSRATRALRSGAADAALEILEQHQRSFPHGALGEERRAAKAQALCALGRVAEGQRELARLTPSTPAAMRARQACER